MYRDKIALLFIKTELERVARTVVKALQLSIFKVRVVNPEVKVTNLPKNQDVTVKNQIKLDQTVAGLQSILKELRANRPLKGIRVENAKDFPKTEIPPYPKFPEINIPEYPKEIEVSNQVDVELLLEEILEEIKKTPGKMPKTVIPPYPKFPEIKFPKFPSGMKVDNLYELLQGLQGNDPKKYLPVRLTDGKKFYEALQEFTTMLRKSDTMPFFLPNGMKSQAAMDEDHKLYIHSDDPMVAYRVSDIDDATNVKYFGFLNNNGKWVIMKQDESGNPKTYRYAQGDTAYATNFTDRASLTYARFSSLTFD